MKKEFNPFLTPQEHEKGVQYWKKQAQLREQNSCPYIYALSRREGTMVHDVENIEALHGFSPIRHLSELLKSGQKNRVAVLDLGGGSGVYAEQLRKTIEHTFGKNTCRVFTTGLRKKLAKKGRRAYFEERTIDDGGRGLDRSERLSQDDLKWRSIFELSDFPEFDLILDTYGERYYSEFPEDLHERTRKFFQTICKKLNPGGLASITPVPEARVAEVNDSIGELGCSAAYNSNLRTVRIFKQPLIKHEEKMESELNADENVQSLWDRYPEIERSLIERVNGDVDFAVANERSFARQIFQALTCQPKKEDVVLLWDIDETLGQYILNGNDMVWQFRPVVIPLIDYLKAEFPGVRHGLMSDRSESELRKNVRGEAGWGALKGVFASELSFSSRDIDLDMLDEDEERDARLRDEMNAFVAHARALGVVGLSPGDQKKWVAMKMLETRLPKQWFLVDDKKVALALGDHGVFVGDCRPTPLKIEER